MNAPVLGKTVFAPSDLVFGVGTNLKVRFHYIFNKEQTDNSVVELIQIETHHLPVTNYYYPSVFRKVVFTLYDLVFGVISKANMLFYSNFM